MRFTVTFCAAIFCWGCAHVKTPVPVAGSMAADSSYYDVKAGDTLRIVLPLTKSGNLLPQFGEAVQQGTTIALSAGDLVGFRAAHYRAAPSRSGRIRLRFISVDDHTAGKVSSSDTPPALPFILPEKAVHLRLVYLIRASAADHNMAIVSAKTVEQLVSFTAQLKRGATECNVGREISCEWVPAGIAVRPES